MDESGGQLLTVLTRTRARDTGVKMRRTRMAGAESEIPSVPKEPQRNMSETK